MLVTAALSLLPIQAGTLPETEPVSEQEYVEFRIAGTKNYDEARQVVKLTNEIRAEAGLAPLTMDHKLTEAAMQRAAELYVRYDHDRPDDTYFTSISEEFYPGGENIALGFANAEEVTQAWKDSPGHYANMTVEDFTAIGVGCFCQNDGALCWVQLFCYEGFGECTETGKKDSVHTIRAKESRVELYADKELDLYVGQFLKKHIYNIGGNTRLMADIIPSYVYSSDPAIVSIEEDGTVKRLKKGDVIIRVGIDPQRYVEIKVRTVKAPGIRMHRLYNPNSGEHFYTAKEKEKNALVSYGWKYEGVGWNAPDYGFEPVYRLYNAVSGDHHYTMNAKERDALVKMGWKYEDIGWYSDDARTAPLYRAYNPKMQKCNHNYTMNKKEHDYLISAGWKDEGIGWCGMMPEVVYENNK